MNENSYFIKNQYTPLMQNFTLDSGDSTYWTESRIQASHFFQYDVYLMAQSLIVKEGIENVLDVGCGPATKLMELLYPVCQNVTGVDQHNAIEVCKARYDNGNFFEDNFENPKHGADKKTFDMIICSDVIEHLVDPNVLLNYIKLFCHKNTIVIFSTPERDCLRGSDCIMANKREHVREWNQSEFLDYLKDRDFNIIKSTLLPPMKPNLSWAYYDSIKNFFRRDRRFNYCHTVVTKLN